MDSVLAAFAAALDKPPPTVAPLWAGPVPWATRRAVGGAPFRTAAARCHMALAAVGAVPDAHHPLLLLAMLAVACAEAGHPLPPPASGAAAAASIGAIVAALHAERHGAVAARATARGPVSGQQIYLLSDNRVAVDFSLL
jgi:hypothetical protein